MKKALEEIQKFIKERDWEQFNTPENLVKSINIEAGELLECFQWSTQYDRAEVLDELADVLYYSLVLADKLDVDVQEIVLAKLEKSKKKYPVEKAKGKTTKYNKL